MRECNVIYWTFETEQIKLSGLPGTPNQLDDSSAPLDLQVESRLTSNIPLDLDIAGDRLLFVNDDDESQVVASTLNLETSDEVTQGQFQPDQEQWHYLVKPKKSLNKASHYRFEAQPGLRPAPAMKSCRKTKPLPATARTAGPIEVP